MGCPEPALSEVEGSRAFRDLGLSLGNHSRSLSPFALLDLDVMTLLYRRYHDDDVFHVEHYAGGGRPLYVVASLRSLDGGKPRPYTSCASRGQAGLVCGGWRCV